MARRPAAPPPEATFPPPPRANWRLFGHGAAAAVFQDGLAAGRLHHAWLVTGPAGVGKRTLAFHLARRLLVPAPHDDPAAPAFRRIAAGTHADVMLLERPVDDKGKRKREIAVDQVRDMVTFMHLTPAEGGWRVIVVDAAEEMNRNAANALLKVLEEPPKRAILLLTSDAPGRLLPTIRSRCRRLRLDALPPAEMSQALDWLLPDVSGEIRARLSAIAEGAPGRAVALSQEDVMGLADLARDVLNEPAMAVPRMYEVADKAVRGDTGFEVFMALLRNAVSVEVREAARGQGGGLRGRPLAEWFEVWHGLGRLAEETTRFALDKRTAIVAGLELLKSP